MKVLLFGVHKGGAAKTSSAVCTAYILGRLGYRTLFIDGDSQCNGSVLFKAKSFRYSQSILDIVYNKLAYREYDVHNAIQKCDCADVIVGDASTRENSDAISKTIELCDEETQFHVFSGIRDLTDYDYVVIDTAPAKSPLLTELLAITDYIIYPIANAECIDGAHSVANIAKTVSQKVGREIKTAGFLLTLAHPQEKNFKVLCHDAKATAGLSKFNASVFSTVIRRRADFNEEIRKQNIPVKTAPSSDASKDYVSFVRELLGTLNKEG